MHSVVCTQTVQAHVLYVVMKLFSGGIWVYGGGSVEPPLR